jgi:DNA mismatch endonuclease (patch repair protein)
MADIFSKHRRSEIMSRVRSRGNKSTELKLIGILRSSKITGWRRRFRIFGNPDLVFPKQRTAIFVDGCFWHRCPKHATKPANNREFWEKKLATNVSRDLCVDHTLRKKGWCVVRLWEHDLKETTTVVNRIEKALKTNDAKEGKNKKADIELHLD